MTTMVQVDERINGSWVDIGRGRTVEGVIRRRHGRTASVWPDNGLRGYGAWIRPAKGGGSHVEARIRWSPVTATIYRDEMGSTR